MVTDTQLWHACDRFATTNFDQWLEQTDSVQALQRYCLCSVKRSNSHPGGISKGSILELDTAREHLGHITYNLAGAQRHVEELEDCRWKGGLLCTLSGGCWPGEAEAAKWTQVFYVTSFWLVWNWMWAQKSGKCQLLIHPGHFGLLWPLFGFLVCHWGQ